MASVQYYLTKYRHGFIHKTVISTHTHITELLWKIEKNKSSIQVYSENKKNKIIISLLQTQIAIKTIKMETAGRIIVTISLF